MVSMLTNAANGSPGEFLAVEWVAHRRTGHGGCRLT